MARPLMGKSIARAVEASAAKFTLMWPNVAVHVHVFAKICLRVKALWRITNFALKNSNKKLQ